MITDINKLQQDIRAIGSVSDSAEFFEGFLRAFDIPVSTIDRLKSTSSYDVNVGVRMDGYLEATHDKRRDASDETEKSTGVYTHYETYCRCPDCHEVFAEFSESCSCGKQMAEEINKVGFYLFNGKEFIESFK